MNKFQTIVVTSQTGMSHFVFWLQWGTLTQQVGAGSDLLDQPEGEEGAADDDGERDVDLQDIEADLPPEGELEEDHGGVPGGRHDQILRANDPVYDGVLG